MIKIIKFLESANLVTFSGLSIPILLIIWVNSVGFAGIKYLESIARSIWVFVDEALDESVVQANDRFFPPVFVWENVL